MANTDQQQKDYDAVKRLREYARRNGGATTDAEFIAWVTDVLKAISADEWQRVKAIIERPQAATGKPTTNATGADEAQTAEA